MFDRRGIFLVITNTHIIILTGSQVDNKYKQSFMQCAYTTINRLKSHENAPSNIVEIKEDFLQSRKTSEDIELFKSLFSEAEDGNYFGIDENWTNWYVHVGKETKKSPEKSMKLSINLGQIQSDDSKQVIVEEKPSVEKKAFYTYPEEEPLSFMDLESLDPEEIMIVMTISNNQMKLYKWMSEDVEYEEDKLKDYIQSKKIEFFGEENLSNIEEIKEVPYAESEEFIALL